MQGALTIPGLEDAIRPISPGPLGGYVDAKFSEPVGKRRELLLIVLPHAGRRCVDTPSNLSGACGQ